MRGWDSGKRVTKGPESLPCLILCSKCFIALNMLVSCRGFEEIKISLKSSLKSNYMPRLHVCTQGKSCQCFAELRRAEKHFTRLNVQGSEKWNLKHPWKAKHICHKLLRRQWFHLTRCLLNTCCNGFTKWLFYFFFLETGTELKPMEFLCFSYISFSLAGVSDPVFSTSNLIPRSVCLTSTLLLAGLCNPLITVAH